MHGSSERYHRLLVHVSGHRLPHICASAAAVSYTRERERERAARTHHPHITTQRAQGTHRTHPPPPSSTVSLACKPSIRTASRRPSIVKPCQACAARATLHTALLRHQTALASPKPHGAPHLLVHADGHAVGHANEQIHKVTAVPARPARTAGTSGNSGAAACPSLRLCGARAKSIQHGRWARRETHILSVTSSSNSMSLPASCCLRNSGATYTTPSTTRTAHSTMMPFQTICTHPGVAQAR
jgi:hypothetical protein